MTYEEQLQTPQWKSKRQEIIDRDWGMCQRCMSTHHLQVHHKKYIDGRMAWEYDGWDSWLLIALCAKCHAAEHGIEWNEPKRSSGWGDSLNPNHRERGRVRHISEVIMDWINGR